MPRYLRLVPPRHFLMKCLYQTRKVIGGQVFVYWGVDFVSFYEFWLDIGTVLTMWNFVLSFYTMPPVLTHNRLQTAGVVCLVITIIHVEIVLTTMSTLYCELWHYICSSWIFMIYLPPNVNQPCNNYITRQTLRYKWTSVIRFSILYPKLSFLLRYTPSLSTPISQDFCKI